MNKNFMLSSNGQNYWMFKQYSYSQGDTIVVESTM